MVMTGSTKIIAIAVIAVVVIAGGVGGALYIMNKDKDDKELTIATSPDFPNYEYMYGEEFTGIDMDIMRAICEELGYKPKFVNVSFDSIVAGVSAGKYDVGASGITINEERAEKVLFSDAYIKAKQVVLAKSAVADEATLLTMKVGVQTGTTGDLYVTEKFSESNIVRYTTYSTAVLALKNGTVDALVLDDGPAKSFANKESLVVSSINLGLEDENYGFIFKKGNTDLQKEFNDAIKKLTEDGTIDKIINYYNDANGDKKSYYANRGESSTSGSKASASNISGAVSPLYLSVSHTAEPETADVGSIIDDIQNSIFEKNRWKYLTTGLKNTIIITLLALFIGLVLGVLIAIVRSVHDMMGKLKILNTVCKVYVTVIRGTPVVVQLLIIYFIIFATSSLNSIIIAAIAFGLNSAAYVAEIVRAGINAVPKGQLEAGFSLGLPFASTMILVILPQAFKNILPALCNEGISLLKETSISGYIGITDLTRAGDIIRSQTFDAVAPLLVVASIYLMIVLVLTYLVSRLERRLKASAV